MSRNDITTTLTQLTEILINKQRGLYSKEVVLDYGSIDMKRADIIAFYPQNETIKGIESGDFICYEIKSCKEDFNSGFGRNAIGDQNYFVMTAQTYLECKEELNAINDFGVYVAIPSYLTANRNHRDIIDWILNPTPFTDNIEDWKLCKIDICNFAQRKRSNLELMFLLLKAKCHGR